MLGDRHGVAAAVVGDANPHLAESRLVELVGAGAGGLDQFQVGGVASYLDRDVRARNHHYLGIAELFRLIFHREAGVHPPHVSALRRDPLKIGQRVSTRPVNHYLSAHYRNSPYDRILQERDVPHKPLRLYDCRDLRAIRTDSVLGSLNYQPTKPSTFVVSLSNHERAALRQAQGEREKWYREMTERPRTRFKCKLALRYNAVAESELHLKGASWLFPTKYAVCSSKGPGFAGCSKKALR